VWQKLNFWSRLGFTPSQYILKCGTERLRAETGKQKGRVRRPEVWASGSGVSLTCIRMPGIATWAGSDACLQGEVPAVLLWTGGLPCFCLLLLFVLPLTITSQSLYNVKWSKSSPVAPLLSSRGAQLALFCPETKLNASPWRDSLGTTEIKSHCGPDWNTLEVWPLTKPGLMLFVAPRGEHDATRAGFGLSRNDHFFLCLVWRSGWSRSGFLQGQ